jgi:hypothetical protein
MQEKAVTTGVDPVSPETIELLAGLAGIRPPREDHATLAALLEGHLESIRSLAQLDLGEEDPICTFDPRWHE